MEPIAKGRLRGWVLPSVAALVLGGAAVAYVWLGEELDEARGGRAIATVLRIENEVVTRRGDRLAWTTAAVDGQLFERDAIRTGGESRARLGYGDGATFDLDPNTLIIVGPMVASAGSRVVVGELTVEHGTVQGRLVASAAPIRIRARDGSSAKLVPIDGKPLEVRVTIPEAAPADTAAPAAAPEVAQGGSPEVSAAAPGETPVVDGDAAGEPVLGTPPQNPDAGTPMAGAGTPVAGAGTPVAGAGTPVAGAGTPVAEAGTPVAGAAAPVAGAAAPVAGAAAPVAGAAAPVAGAAAPVAGAGPPVGANPAVGGLLSGATIEIMEGSGHIEAEGKVVEVTKNQAVALERGGMRVTTRPRPPQRLRVSAVAGAEPPAVQAVWGAIDGAAGYRVQVAIDERFAHPLHERTVTDPWFEQVVPGAETVFVRVATVSDGGASDWALAPGVVVRAQAVLAPAAEANADTVLPPAPALPQGGRGLDGPAAAAEGLSPADPRALAPAPGAALAKAAREPERPPAPTLEARVKDRGLQVRSGRDGTFEARGGRVMLQPGDALQTGARPSELGLPNADALRFDPDTAVELREIAPDGSRVGLAVERGRLEANVREGRTLVLEGAKPLALAAERGRVKVEVVRTSDGALQVTASGGTALATSGGGEPMALKPGEMLIVAPAGEARVERPPPAPGLLGPQAGADFLYQDSPPPVTFRWGKVAGARYRLVASLQPDLSRPVIEENLATESLTSNVLAGGSYYWDVAAIGPTGLRSPKRAPRTFTVTVKASGPALELSEPGDGLVTRAKDVTLRGKTDAGASVKVDGRRVTVAADGSFQHTYRLRAGTNRIYIEAIDAAGNSTIGTRRVRLE